MAKYTNNNIGALAKKIKAKSTTANKAASLALNKTGTFTVAESAKQIMDEVNLDASYIRKHLRVVARASPANLRTIIHATDRATLLTRYPHLVTPTGIKVSVNKSSSFRTLKGAFKVSGLRGSAASGIALRNRDAVEFFKAAMGKGKRTPAKSRKLQRLIAKARTKPNGIEVLHTRSINQLFLTVRDDVSPMANTFLLEEFLKQYRRLDR